MNKSLILVGTNDITPVTLYSEDSNQISQADLALFSLDYANKIKKAVDNPSGGGTTLKGYNALTTISEAISTATDNKATLILDDSYAEVVTNGEYVFLDFVLRIASNITGSGYYTPVITIQLDNPTEKILTGHVHYVDACTIANDGVVKASTSFPAGGIYFDQDNNKIVLKLERINIPTNQNVMYSVSIPIFPNVIPAPTQASE